MELEELVPGNTKHAKATAVGSFVKFLKTEGVTEEYVRVCIERDGSGKCFVSVMDKHLMRVKKGKPLTRNTAMQYYRQAKLWLLDQFPQHRAALEARLLKMGKTLNNFCLKRDGGGFISKAPPCSKDDLKKMLVYLYVNASCSSDYQDAALICLLWYLFGRASDLALLRKPNISIDAGNVLFVRFIRMKTSEKQGLSLFPGTEFETCPMFAMALAMLTALSTDVIDNLPDIQDPAAITLSPDVPLLDILDHPADTTGLGAPSAAGVEKTPTVYSHVNRVLDNIAAAAGVTAAHKPHSFRRGGAQHANGSGELTARWIFDRGTWNTSTTNKGFNYSFNISKEDHMVGKILSGHDTSANVAIQDLRSFDSQTRSTISSFQRHLRHGASPSQALNAAQLQAVLDVLTSTVIRHYPLLKRLNHLSSSTSKLVPLKLDDRSLSYLHGRHISRIQSYPVKTASHQAHQTSEQSLTRSIEQKVIDHKAAVINHFIEHVKLQDARMDALEAKMNGPTQKIHKRQFRKLANVMSVKSHHLPISKQQKSDATQLVTYMKLFLDDGFILDTTEASYRDQVLSIGTCAEKSVLMFLEEHNISSRESGAVLKHLRSLHRAGALNTKIERHEQLLQTPAIQDTASGNELTGQGSG
ncbi:LOW QUALITY PROTEIN: Hypothetical protein PHPALM_512 [Phytophthora palmivora]|uniref:Ndc10 domain-containing protein n=1 Tax=Phytophthora palmivora TaxID=4796 RepID=A0A2P4YUN3_9STRA|nr:LOW QUALITY PROTEIN: Hypothetical protein PHPALM_512 [Phytophthora palmivora]